LQRIFGVLGGAAGQPGKPVQLPSMPVEQLVEGVPVAPNMGCQQLGVTAFPWRFSPEAHWRDSNESVVARHFTRTGAL
jgi:hypothetical protein